MSAHHESPIANLGRFKISNNDNNWSLPDELAEYFNGDSAKFIPEKDPKESIMKENLILENILSCGKIDPYLKNMMGE